MKMFREAISTKTDELCCENQPREIEVHSKTKKSKIRETEI